MKCPKCKKAKLRQQVSVYVECDADNRNLSKKGIRSKDVRILGAGWPHASLLCQKCGWFHRLDSKDATP